MAEHSEPVQVQHSNGGYRRSFLVLAVILGGVVLVISLSIIQGDENDDNIGFKTATMAAYDATEELSPFYQTATAYADAGQAVRNNTPPPSPTALPFSAGGGGGGGYSFYTEYETLPLEQRVIIKDAELSIRVEDAEQGVTQIANIAQSMGGWVVSSHVQLADTDGVGGWGNITVRVPADRLDEAIERIKGMALAVDSESTTGEDVTEQFTDLQSQLRNYEASEAQLQEIMDGAEDTEAVLDVFNQLVQTRNEIERIRGQLQFFEQSAAFSRLSVELRLPLPDPSPTPTPTATPEDSWRPGDAFNDATDSAVETAQSGVDIVIWVIVYGVLILAVFGIPALLIYRVWRMRQP